VGPGCLSHAHNGTSCVPEKLHMTHKPHDKVRQAVWEQLHTNAILLNPPSIAIVFSELYSASEKANLAVYCYSVAVSG